MERRGEEVPRRPGPSSLARSVSFLHLSCLICSPSISPLFYLLPSLRCDPRRVDGWRPAAIDRLTAGEWISCRTEYGRPSSSICRLLSMPMNTVEFSCRGGICMYVWMYHYYHKYSLPRLPLLPPIFILAIDKYVGRWFSFPGWRIIRQTDQDGPFISFPFLGDTHLRRQYV